MCTADSPNAQGCHIIQGTASIIVNSDDTSEDDYIVEDSYHQLEYIFTQLSVDDANIIDLDYIGTDASDLSSVEKLGSGDNTAPGDSSTFFTTIFIATSGSLAAIAALMVGLNRLKQNEELPIHADEKADDHSTALDTADLTYSISCESSEISSLSPTSRCGPEITKHFVVAEEETDNWRRLGVIPNVGSGVSSLEGVSEGAFNDEGDERSI